MRIWIEFAKQQPLRYLSHLDLMRLWQRAIRRAGLPVVYSLGFNPHPKMSFASALPVGVISDAEYLDIQFAKDISEQDLITLQNVLPIGLLISGWRIVPESVPALMALVRAVTWVMPLDEPIVTVQATIEQLLATTELLVERKGKKGIKTVNIRPFIYKLQVEEETARLLMLLASGGEGGTKPRELLELLQVHPDSNLRRTETLLEVNAVLQSPMAVLLKEKEVSINAKENHYQL
ncbi:MAG: TIGR03936 family radical SAM-associated protein [Firmicutes bacterium]|nr:TIGR03936 family radical SAM-associated protein [Bacillota bacterium]